MIDQWFRNDLKNIYDTHNVAVLIDESKDAEFLLKTVEKEYTILQAHSELEELHVKYLVEKARPSQERFLLYTHQKREKLKFLREYCETCGCLEIRYLQNYIKDKVHRTLNLNINLSKEDLVAAAKVSVGKDRTYWMDIAHKGATEIFDLNKELLPFLHNPDRYVEEKYDDQLRDAFYRKVNELLGQEYLKKPAKTLSSEVAKAMFDGLLYNRCDKTLESVYISWLDSVSYSSSFFEYLDRYNLSSDVDIWNVSINHPFRQLDEQWLSEIGKSISNKTTLPITLAQLGHRDSNKQAQALGTHFWHDVITLLEFDQKNIAYLSDFNECVGFYVSHFYKLDTAIRNLYTEFLNKKELIEPFQELYKEYVSVFLDRWFGCFHTYKEDQTGILQRIIDEAGGLKTAIIVGDGVTYEIAELVAAKVKGSEKVKKNSILADIPSETENNMSRIYMANGITEAIHSNREKYLVAQNPGTTINFIRLDEVTEEARPGQFLVCTYKDVDDLGEKLQQKALKYFPDLIESFAEKISILLSSGYAKVYLISDHGFVLTGILSDAEKISVSPVGEFDKAERYIRTVNQQPTLLPGLIEIMRGYKQYNYLYFAKNINPFKTPGLYGFSHGGLSPQELVIPFFCWERSVTAESSLSVSISNKGDLKDVTGELFSIKLQAGKSVGDLFSEDRRVFLVFFADNVQVNKSDVFTIKQNERITKDFEFDSHPEMEVHLLDASTKEQLDRAVVKQNQARDLGGLL
jgi:hypothetical protein